MIEKALAGTAIRAINHLLAGAAWARDRLRPFAGQAAAIRGPFSSNLLSLRFAITPEGFFQPAAGNSPPAVDIILPADFPARVLLDRAGAFGAARLCGAADLAEALSFVFRHLSWDVEDDLARLVGDIPARRLSLGAQHLLAAQRRGLQAIAANLGEYLREESGILPAGRDVTAFAENVRHLTQDTAALEKRLARLSGQHLAGF